MQTPPPACYAVLGNPVAHSRSPAIHSAFAAATGQQLRYTWIEPPVAGFAAALQAFADAGGLGCNVTMPFKLEAYQLAIRRSHRATLAQAANTLGRDGAGWWADNTDGVGLLRDIEHNAGVTVASRRVLLIGAGGAAAGVLGPLIEARPAEVVLVNRSADKAQALADRHRDLAEACGVRLCALPLAQPGQGFDLVINASASSLAGAGSPVSAQVLRPGCLALDLAYGPPARPFLDWAASHGALTRDGLGMLVEQAAEAFSLWRGVRPATHSVLAKLRQDVDTRAAL
jgi:shikimate dehydrogenase